MHYTSRYLFRVTLRALLTDRTAPPTPKPQVGLANKWKKLLGDSMNDFLQCLVFPSHLVKAGLGNARFYPGVSCRKPRGDSHGTLTQARFLLPYFFLPSITYSFVLTGPGEEEDLQ